MTEKYTIETSLTLDYRKKKWGLERIVLDGIANHMPDDSKGTEVKVEVKQGNEYKDFRQIDPNKEIEEIVFTDNGKGYDANLLSVLFSTKSADDLSVGQHGEGMKLVACAALRNNFEIEYRSRNWTAVPYKKPEEIDGNKLDRLCFEITVNGENIKGSKTIFKNPSQELVQEVLLLPQKVLYFNDDYEVLYEEGDSGQPPLLSVITTKKIIKPVNNIITKEEINPSQIDVSQFIKSSKPSKRFYKSRIIDLKKENPQLFIKGFRVRDSKSIFSYDLRVEDISPDRSNADYEEITERVKRLLLECDEPRVLEKILLEAGKNINHIYLEFQVFYQKEDNESRFKNDYSFQNEIKGKINEKYFDELKELLTQKENPWITAFKKVYGENAIIASSDTNVNNDARLMNYEPILLAPSITNHLSRLGVLRAADLKIKSEYKWISLEDLTEEERFFLSKTPKIADNLGEPVPEVKIYAGLFLNTGREIESAWGVQITETDGKKYIGVKRERLRSLKDYTSTLIHELGHESTGAGDFQRGFADYFINKLTEKVLRDIK